ncbi:YcxB family protein [Enterococcus sp. LJL51]|uniref:YcxB family protein n=1 Tax=Enterococcus sp. LJL51 TaxID=3416656 RepID=UPI003CE793FA
MNETNNHFLFFRSEKVITAVPKNQLTAAEIEKLRTMVQTYYLPDLTQLKL